MTIEQKSVPKKRRKYGDRNHPQVKLTRELLATRWQTCSYASVISRAKFKLLKHCRDANEPDSPELAEFILALYDAQKAEQKLQIALKYYLKKRKESNND